MAKRYSILKNCSIFYRLTQMHYAIQLRPYGLGAGQQSFLSQIATHPGISMAEMAEQGAYDNGTITRAVRKLENGGYIRIEPDKRDRRAKRLFPTEKGLAMIEPIQQMRHSWFLATTKGFTDEEKDQIDALLQRLASNAREYFSEEQESAILPEEQETDAQGTEDWL